MGSSLAENSKDEMGSSVFIMTLLFSYFCWTDKFLYLSYLCLPLLKNHFYNKNLSPNWGATVVGKASDAACMGICCGVGAVGGYCCSCSPSFCFCSCCCCCRLLNKCAAYSACRVGNGAARPPTLDSGVSAPPLLIIGEWGDPALSCWANGCCCGCACW